VIPKRPINRDVPPAEETEARSEEKEEKAQPNEAKPAAETAAQQTRPPQAKPPREPKSQTPKLLAGLVVLALVFIVAAIVFATGGDESKSGHEVTTSTPASGNESDSSEPSPQVAEALAFPAFATNNTTRIGGPDPAANAAAVALAVFPSTNEKQRPVAVALASTEDWAGAIAAAVLMAEPIRAPLLYAEAESLPEPTKAALEALQPRGGAASGGAAALAIGDVAADGLAVALFDRNGDAAAEAAGIARLRDRLAGKKPEAIVLASSTEPAYAAPAAAYAARSGDPVLFTEAETLPQPTVAELRRDEGVPVYALGPTSAISGEVLKEVEELGGKKGKATKVTRISGSNPVQSAISFARFEGGKFGWHISDPGHGFVLGRSEAPLEAAAAAPLSASGTWGPLLLTDSADTLPSELRGYFLDVKPGYTTDPTRAFYNHVWIVGDTGQISVEQQAEVNEIAELAKIGSGE